MIDTIKKTIENALLDDDTFYECFCHNCLYKVCTEASYYEPIEIYCGLGAEFEMTDSRCSRYGDWLKIGDLTKKIADIATETFRVGVMKE